MSYLLENRLDLHRLISKQIDWKIYSQLQWILFIKETFILAVHLFHVSWIPFVQRINAVNTHLSLLKVAPHSIFNLITINTLFTRWRMEAELFVMHFHSKYWPETKSLICCDLFAPKHQHMYVLVVFALTSQKKAGFSILKLIQSMKN